MDTGFRRVLRSDKLVAGGPGEPRLKGARVGRTELLLVRFGTGDVAAFAAHCPHQGTPLDNATLFDDHLRCPRHVFLYDLRTGENLVPAKASRPETLRKLKPGYLPIHRVEERDGWIWVSETPEPPPAAYDPRLEQDPPAGEEAAGETVGEPAEPADAAPATTAAGEAASERTGRTRVGEEFELVLTTTPRPGHFWKVDVPGGAATVIDQRLVAGDPPASAVRLTARAAGTVTVSCAYGTPWGATPAAVAVFQVEIEA